jgi:hypothetical protein
MSLSFRLSPVAREFLLPGVSVSTWIKHAPLDLVSWTRRSELLILLQLLAPILESIRGEEGAVQACF